MNYSDQALALAFIKAGITPRFLEQSNRIAIKKAVDVNGFTPENMETIFERWDIDGARKRIRAQALQAQEKRRKEKAA